MHKVTIIGLIILGISAAVGIVSFGVNYSQYMSFGNRFSVMMGSPPPLYVLSILGMVGGGVGSVVGIIVSLIGVAQNKPAA